MSYSCQLAPISFCESHMVNAARSILYDCYISELNWEIEHDNPSGIRIEVHNGRQMIVDDYDHLSVWFSIKNHDTMVGCARLCRADAQGLLEIERYQAAKVLLESLLNKKKDFNILEFNREAMLPELFNKPHPYLLLLQSVFQYGIEHDCSILTTTNLPDWEKIYDMIAFPKVKHAVFKYSPKESQPVEVYFATKDQLPVILKQIEHQLELCSSNVKVYESIER